MKISFKWCHICQKTHLMKNGKIFYDDVRKEHNEQKNDQKSLVEKTQ